MEPAVGIEPTTSSLQNCRSATELSRPETPKNVAVRAMALPPSPALGFHHIFAGTPRFVLSNARRSAAPRFGTARMVVIVFDFQNPKNVAVRAVRPDNCDKTERTNRTYITRSVRLVRSNRGLYVLLCPIRPVLICRGGLRWRGRPHFHELF